MKKRYNKPAVWTVDIITPRPLCMSGTDLSDGGDGNGGDAAAKRGTFYSFDDDEEDADNLWEVKSVSF